VDDVLATGGSLLKALDALAAEHPDVRWPWPTCWWTASRAVVRRWRRGGFR
jgi:hypothetical protein